MKLLVPFGTRPEIVKLAPVVHALQDAGHAVHVLATGQHWDPGMTDTFIERLALPVHERWQPERDASEGQRVGALLAGAFDAIARVRPDAVVVLGDTYTVPLFAMAARRHGVPLVHLEAGLRSFNDRSMEEVNRKLAAATASLHLAPTELAAAFLRHEGVPAERIEVVGNPVLDALRRLGVSRVPVSARRGVVVTAHRATNVDDPIRLESLVGIVADLARSVGPVTFPLHPRTRARLEEFGMLRRLAGADITVTEPLEYEPMLRAMAGAQLVVTDSGGVQEEASWLGVPVVVLRNSTPRWEGVLARTAVLAGLDRAAVLEAAKSFTQPDEQARIAAAPCPYGDGFAGRAVARALDAAVECGLLELTEPASADVPLAVLLAV